MTDRWNRREVLSYSGKFLASLAAVETRWLPQALASSPQPWLIGAWTPEEAQYATANNEAPEFLSLIPLGKGQPQKIELDHRVHSIAFSPTNPRSILVVTKPGTASYLVSLEEKPKVVSFSVLPNHKFSGHGVFSPVEPVVFTGERSETDGKGSIVARSAVSGEMVRVMPGHGMDPHEMRIVDGGKTLVQASVNEDGFSALNFIDSRTGRLLESYRSHDDKNFIRHFWIGPDGRFAIGTKTNEKTNPEAGTPAVIYLGRRGNKSLTRVQLPEKKLHDFKNSYQYLSIEYHEASDTIAATSDSNDSVVFVRYRDAKFRSALRLKRASGVSVTPDGKYFVVCGHDADLWFIDPVSLSVIKKSKWRRQTGSHLYSHRMTG